MSPRGAVAQGWVPRLLAIGLVALAGACLFPGDEGSDDGVIAFEIVTLQRVDSLEQYVTMDTREFGVTRPVACDSVAAGAATGWLLTCRWVLSRPAGSSFQAEPPIPFRLGDRVVVHARVGQDGPAGTEVRLVTGGGLQRGPVALRISADTIDLLSVGETRILVYAAGFPSARPDTLVLFTHPARISPPCGTAVTPPCAVDSIAIGDTIEVAGGPFEFVDDPATGARLAVLPEPTVTIGRVPAPVVERTNTRLRVAVPAGEGLLQVAILGLPAACTPSDRNCYESMDYALQNWDVLEPDSAAFPTDLVLAQSDSVLVSHPSLALEGRSTPWALDAAGRAHDWYTFTLTEPMVVQVELTSAVPVDIQVSDTLSWAADLAKARVVPGGWAVGSRPACRGVEVAFAFPEADQGGVKRMTAPLAAGRHHLVVSSTGPLPSVVGYGLRLIRGGVVPSDDSRCESAAPFQLPGTHRVVATGQLDGAFDVDWFVTRPTDSTYAEFLATSRVGEVPALAVLRDHSPDSLPVIAQGDGHSTPLLTTERHLIALLGNGRAIPYTLSSRPTAWGPPATLELAGVPAAAAACEAWDVTVTVQDQLGNRVLGYTGTVEFASSDPEARLPAAYTFTAADAGRHRFTSGVAFHNEGAATLSVSEAGAAGLTGNAAVTVTPPALRVAVDPPVATVGVGEQVSFTSSVFNTCGVSVSAPVTWTSMNPARATMAANVVTGVASGQAALRADAGGRPTYAFLTVTAPRPSTPLTWEALIGAVEGDNLRDVWAAGPTAAWAVGTPGLIMAFDGSTWSAVRSTGAEAAADTLFGIWGTGPTDVWAVGTNGTVLHYDGSAWATMNAGTDRTLRDVWAASPEDVWIVGDAGIILRYDGLAFGFVPVTEYPGVDHFMVWGRTPSEVLIGGGERVFRRYDGQTVATLSHDETFDTRVLGLWGVSPTDMRFWTVCRNSSNVGGAYCSNLVRWDGSQLVTTEQPPPPEGTSDTTFYGQSVLGTDATEFWYLTTQGLVAGAEANWTTLLSRATSAAWSCSTAGPPGIEDRLTGVASGFVSLPGDLWIVGTCFDLAGDGRFRSLILHGRY